MAMTWGPLRRWIHPHEQVPTTEPDEHGLGASEGLRERQKLRQALDAERVRTELLSQRPSFGNDIGFMG
jgi:hypothetical protein